MVNKSKKRSKIDKGQPTLFDFGEDILSKIDVEEKLDIIQASQNRLDRLEDVVDKISDNENNKDESNLRSEQIIISKENYPTISDSDNLESIYKSIDKFSFSCHKSKNIFNQCIYEIRQSFFGKIDINNKDHNIKDDREKQLRNDIRKTLDKYKNSRFEDLKNKNYKNAIYKLLDKYFEKEYRIKRK